MERDMDLCREILRQMAEHRDLNSPVEIQVEGRPPEEIAFNVYQLMDGGLIEAQVVSDLQGPAYKPLRITWKGSEFYDAAKDETIWRRGKELVLKAGGGLSYDALSAVLTALIREGTGLGL
jgi:Hypothetical protein (DUF2513)